MTKEEAIKELEYIRESFAVNEFSDEAIGMAIEALQEKKMGKWITMEKGLLVTIYECSECKRHVIDDTGYDVAKDYPFCHCGAKMEEEDDE